MQVVTCLRYLALQPVPHDPDVYGPHNKDTTRYFACDTEVACIDVTKQSPVSGHMARWPSYKSHFHPPSYLSIQSLSVELFAVADSLREHAL
jgi:hypothetical protein